MSILAAAIGYSELGFNVLPLGSSKAPLTPRGVHDATRDRGTIQRWFSQRECCLGVAAGRASGLLVVDCDPRNGSKKSLAEISWEYGPLEDTGCPIAVTGSGGRHYVFRYPTLQSGESIRGKLAPGIDILADGRYFLVAPSESVAGAYRWLVPPTDIPQMPAWLRDLVVRDDSVTASLQSQVGHDGIHCIDDAQSVRRAITYLAKCAPAVSGANGHSTTLNVAIRLITLFPLSNHMAFRVLWRWNQKNEPPWSDIELARKVSEARRIIDRRRGGM